MTTCGRCTDPWPTVTNGQSSPCCSDQSHEVGFSWGAVIHMINPSSTRDTSRIQKTSRSVTVGSNQISADASPISGLGGGGKDRPGHGPDRCLQQARDQVLGRGTHSGMRAHRPLVWRVLDLHVPAVHHHHLPPRGYIIIPKTFLRPFYRHSYQWQCSQIKP